MHNYIFIANNGDSNTITLIPKLPTNEFKIYCQCMNELSPYENHGFFKITEGVREQIASSFDLTEDDIDTIRSYTREV